MGTGVSLGLPWLECMVHANSPERSQQPERGSFPKRFCSMYFGFGVSLPKEDSDDAKWRWFPNGEGTEFEFNASLKPLDPLRDKLSILGGLSHPNGRRMGAHDTGDTFLTGAFIQNKFLQNTASVDQVAAAALRDRTRYPSLVLSTDGGVGEPTRSSTLSYDLKGRPIPALNQPQQVFDRFFGVGDEGALDGERKLRSSAKMLDRILDDSNSLKRRLGVGDRRRVDEYLSSVRQIEQGVERSQKWLEIPRPQLSDKDREDLRLEADDEAPLSYIRTMYDLLYLALRTDSTRVATYQITNMADASSKAGKFPQLEGFKNSLHKLAHDWNKPGGAEALGSWDRFMIEQFTYFLTKLDSAQEGQGSLLDHTLVLYGSSNSVTHNNSNYPLVLAGGSELGLRHGRYLKYQEDVPMSNLLLTILERLDIPAEQFADSTGTLSNLLSA